MSEAGEQAAFFGKFGRLVESGIPMLRAFEAALSTVTDRALGEALARVLDRAYGGSSLADACAEEAGRFGREVLCLLGEGERMGDVERKAAAIAAGLSAGDFAAGDEAAPRGALDALLKAAAEAGASAVHLSSAGALLRVGGRLQPVDSDTDGLALLAAAAARGPVFSEAGRRIRLIRAPGPDAFGVLHLRPLEPARLGSLPLPAGCEREVRDWLARHPGLVLAVAADSGAAEVALSAMVAEIDRGARRVVTRGAADLPGVWRVPEGTRLADLDPDVAVLGDMVAPGAREEARELLWAGALVLAAAGEDACPADLSSRVLGRLVAVAGPAWDVRNGGPGA